MTAQQTKQRQGVVVWSIFRIVDTDLAEHNILLMIEAFYQIFELLLSCTAGCNRLTR
jgi:hypothetical protein